MHPLGFAYYPDGAHGFKQYAEVFTPCLFHIMQNIHPIAQYVSGGHQNVLSMSCSRARRASPRDGQRATVPLQSKQPISQGVKIPGMGN